MGLPIVATNVGDCGRLMKDITLVSLLPRIILNAWQKYLRKPLGKRRTNTEPA